jgi:hypothetical protein
MARHEMTDAELRRFWRQLWLTALQAFADSETQRSQWLDPDQCNPHFSFVECMNCYFEDVPCLGQEEGYRTPLELGHLSEAEAACVAEFHALAVAYEKPCDPWDAAGILADPAWQRLVLSAQRAQRALLATLEDPDEIAILTRPVTWDGNNVRSIVPAAPNKRGLAHRIRTFLRGE